MDTASTSSSSFGTARSKRSKWSVSKARKLNRKRESIDDYNYYEEGGANEGKKSQCEECREKRRQRKQGGKTVDVNFGGVLGAYFHRVLNGSTWKRLGRVMLLFEKRLDRLERKIRELERAEAVLEKKISKQQEAKEPVSVCHVLVDSTPTTKDIGTSVDGLIIVTSSNESRNGLQWKSSKIPKRKNIIQKSFDKKNVIKPIEFDRLGIAYRLGILKCPPEISKVNGEDIQGLSIKKNEEELSTPIEKKENAVIVEN